MGCTASSPSSAVEDRTAPSPITTEDRVQTVSSMDRGGSIDTTVEVNEVSVSVEKVASEISLSSDERGAASPLSSITGPSDTAATIKPMQLPPNGSITFEIFLQDGRVQALILDGKTDEDKLQSLFVIYDEDQDGLVSESEAADIIWVTEAAHSHLNSSANTPVKGSSEAVTPVAGDCDSRSDNASASIDSPRPTARAALSLAEDLNDSEASSLTLSVPVQSPAAQVELSTTAQDVPTRCLGSETDSGNTPQSLSSPVSSRATGPAKSRPRKKLVYSPVGDHDSDHSPFAASAEVSPTPSTLDMQSAPTTPTKPPASASLMLPPSTAAIKRAVLEKKQSMDEQVGSVEELGIPADQIPTLKKGFLKVYLSPVDSLQLLQSPDSAPNKRSNAFHVLDSGLLYRMDSAGSRQSFSMDRLGWSLHDRLLSVHDNVILMSPREKGEQSTGDRTAEQVICVELRSQQEQELKDWQKALQSHIEFADLVKKLQRGKAEQQASQHQPQDQTVLDMQ